MVIYQYEYIRFGIYFCGRYVENCEILLVLFDSGHILRTTRIFRILKTVL